MPSTSSHNGSDTMKVINVGDWMIQFGLVGDWSLELVAVEYSYSNKFHRVLYCGPVVVSWENTGDDDFVEEDNSDRTDFLNQASRDTRPW